MALFDDVAEHYDATRGGEARGDEYAAQLHRLLPQTDRPVLEVGMGTGVVALGLRRRGRRVLGVDVARQMLARAHDRLGPVLVLGDGRHLPFGSASMDGAVSVWVVHAVDDPQRIFVEVARVLRPGACYLVCPRERVEDDNPIKRIMETMWRRAGRVHPRWRFRPIDAPQIVAWAKKAGFVARVETFTRQPFDVSAEELIEGIVCGAYPALHGLSERDLARVAGPALAALHALPEGPIAQRAEADIVVLRKP